ncbi:TPA: hypothetical protein EYG59_24775 [Candidatus Poribacteria bacterium]|nr:hypothetical protein [Candidatus Poribacteria bacterium]
MLKRLILVAIFALCFMLISAQIIGFAEAQGLKDSATEFPSTFPQKTTVMQPWYDTFVSQEGVFFTFLGFSIHVSPSNQLSIAKS